MTTEERLDKLEKELARAKRRNRRLLAVVGLAVGVFALVWIVSGAASRAQAQGGGVPTVIRANAFVLVDEDGKTRAMLDAHKDLSGLYLLDEACNVRASLGVQGEGPILTLNDAAGKSRVGLSVPKDGPSVFLRDAAGKSRAKMTVTDQGTGLVLFDQKGKARAGLGACQTALPDGKKITHPESSLILFGPDGKAIWQAP